MNAEDVRVGILTISDRASGGEYDDRSGPLIREIVEERLEWGISLDDIVPDEQEQIEAALTGWSDDEALDLLLTTGGTGFTPRDRTPEATLAVVDREAPGMAEAMRAASLKVTPYAMLSRAVVGIRGYTLIVNLPGSPKAVHENLEVLLPVLPHAVEMLKAARDSDQDHEYRKGTRSM